MSKDKLIEQAEKYTLSDEVVEQSERGRISFVAKFLLNKIKD